jgi:hypothetical protein
MSHPWKACVQTASRILLAIGLAGGVAPAALAHPDVRAEKAALEARVDAIRARLKAPGLDDEARAKAPRWLAQWFNWPNWGNWNNWNNWANWRNF